MTTYYFWWAVQNGRQYVALTTDSKATLLKCPPYLRGMGTIGGIQADQMAP